MTKMTEEEKKKKIEELEKESYILKHTKKCVVCGKEFVAQHNAKCCSQSCRAKKWKKENDSYYKERNKRLARREEAKRYQKLIEHEKMPDIYYSTDKTYEKYF